MKAFLGTAFGKVVIGVLAAAVVAGGGYGVYRAVQSDPVPAAVITDPAEEVTTTKTPTTTKAETTTEENTTETPTETPTVVPTAAPTVAQTTIKATTTSTTKAPTKPAAFEPGKVSLRGMPVVWTEKDGVYSCYVDIPFPIGSTCLVPEGCRWESDDGTKLKAGEDMIGQQNGTLYWIG